MKGTGHKLHQPRPELSKYVGWWGFVISARNITSVQSVWVFCKVNGVRVCFDLRDPRDKVHVRCSHYGSPVQEEASAEVQNWEEHERQIVGNEISGLPTPFKEHFEAGELLLTEES